jgi:Ulp1 family protease
VQVLNSILRFLDFEWRHSLEPRKPREFNQKAFKHNTPRVPGQSNDWDCGLFVLHYAELFARDPTHLIDKVVSKDRVQRKSLEHWFDAADVQTNKRAFIRDKLNQLKCLAPVVEPEVVAV